MTLTTTTGADLCRATAPEPERRVPVEQLVAEQADPRPAPRFAVAPGFND